MGILAAFGTQLVLALGTALLAQGRLRAVAGVCAAFGLFVPVLVRGAQPLAVFYLTVYAVLVAMRMLDFWFEPNRMSPARRLWHIHAFIDTRQVRARPRALEWKEVGVGCFWLAACTAGGVAWWWGTTRLVTPWSLAFAALGWRFTTLELAARSRDARRSRARRNIMRRTIRSTSTAILLSFLLCCSVRAQSSARPPTPLAAAATEVVDLGSLLRKTSRLMLPIEALDELNRGAAFRLTLLEGKTFSTTEPSRAATRGCSGELKISGNSVTGSCVYKFASPSAGCSFPEPQAPCPPKTFSFTLTARTSSNGQLVYDLTRACLGTVCASEDDLCVQLTEAPREGEASDQYDCTPRALYPPFQKATPAALTALLADLEKRNMSMTFGNLVLRPDRTFSNNDINTYACWGKWLQKGLRLNGSCLEGMEPSRMQKTGGDFNLDVERISDGALIVSGRICTSTRDGCQEKATFRWFRPHGVRDRPEESTVQLIPGADDHALFAAVKNDLRTKYREDFAASGHRPPLLIEGPPAKKPRTTTEIYFGPDGEAMAATLATLLKPIVGTVKPEPWPGQTDHQAIIVVGETAAILH